MTSVHYKHTRKNSVGKVVLENYKDKRITSNGTVNL